MIEKKKPGKRGKETEHLRYLRQGCAQYMAWFYKIPDLPMRAQNPKPFDAFLNAFGAAVAIEAKFRNEPGVRFGLSDLSEGQRLNLEKFQMGGGLSVAVVFHHVPGLNPRMYWFSWSDLEGGRYAISPELRSLEAERVKIPKTQADGKIRYQYEWKYDCWDFLKWCTDEWSKNFREQLQAQGSGAALGLGRSLRFYLPALVAPNRLTE